MKTITPQRVVKSAKEAYNRKNTEHDRYFSWDYCYEAFCDARRKARQGIRPDYDLLSLRLGFYLASWGMFRSSFLLEKTYTIHEPMVREILKKKYDVLWQSSEDCSTLPANKGVLFHLEEILKRYYDPFRGKGVKAEVSQILTTKILLGTLGCVPAYDRCFKNAVKVNDVTTGTFNERSIDRLVAFYKTNKPLFESARKVMRTATKKIPYPQMKLLDMAFWQIGQELEESKRAKSRGK